MTFAWVAGDEVCGSDGNLRLWLERADGQHVRAIKKSEKLWAWTGKGPRQVRADRLASQVEETGWTRSSAGNVAKGPRVYDLTTFVLLWSSLRRRHQAKAWQCHYQRRLSLLN